MKKILYIGAIAVLALSSCSDSNQFSIAGVIDGANDEKLIIERSESGTWVVMDTILTDGSGNFDYFIVKIIGIEKVLSRKIVNRIV